MYHQTLIEKQTEYGLLRAVITYKSNQDKLLTYSIDSVIVNIAGKELELPSTTNLKVDALTQRVCAILRGMGVQRE